MARKFVSVSLPADLIDVVDEFKDRTTLDYGSRPEVINEAIRRFISAEMPELKVPPLGKQSKKKGKRDKT